MKKKYKILFIDHGAKPIGGGQMNIISLIKDIDKNIFEPSLISSKENAFTCNVKSMGIPVNIIKYSETLSLAYRNEVNRSKYLQFLRIKELFNLVYRLYVAIKKNQYDIIHPCDNVSRIAASFAARIAGVPIVCQITDDYEYNFINLMLIRCICLNMDYIMPVSNKVAIPFNNRINTKKVKVLYIGIDFEYYTRTITQHDAKKALNIKSEVLVISIIANLIPIKGHNDLFCAIAKFKKVYSQPFRCLVVGDGPLMGALVKYAKDLKIEEEVIFLGHRQDIPSLLSAIDILVVPSHTEAAPRVILEAAAMSVPAIATNVGGNPEMIQDGVTGILVQKGDTDAISNALFQLKDESTREVMGKLAYDRAILLHCNKKITKAIEEIYITCIQK